MSVKSIQTTHSPFQMGFLIISAISILNVGTVECLFSILKSITLHQFLLETTCCKIPQLLTFLLGLSHSFLTSGPYNFEEKLVSGDLYIPCELWDASTL